MPLQLETKKSVHNHIILVSETAFILGHLPLQIDK
jgi:hypothetical protein